MKQLIALSLSSLAPWGIHAAETVDITSAWQVMAVKAEAADKLEKVLPEKGEWKDGALQGKIPLATGAKGGNLIDGEYNAWYKKSVDIPAAWKGKSVRYEQDLNFCSAVVFVNGKEAGVAYFPDGTVELSPYLKFGVANEIKVFVTNRGYGTGETGIQYRGRGDWSRGFGGAALEKGAKLVARTPAFIDDVYAKPSWRGTQDKDGKWDGKKKLTVEVEVEAIDSGKAEFTVEIAHDGGGVAKTAKETAKLKKGSNLVTIDIPFEDAQPWETVAHPKLYTCDVAMKFSGQDSDDNRGKFLFGFREIWLAGKEIMMNGHVQRFRGFWQQGMPKDVNDLHKYGYNLAYETHKHWAILSEDPKALETKSRAGVAVFAGMPTIVYAREAVRKDPTMSAQWHRCLKHWLKTMRNYPCIVAASCGVNQICPERNMRPDILGQDPETNGVAQNIEYAREEARKLHPNCLYFSHADGTEADMSSSNLYFNFTPLQEREEWLSQWAEKGTLPWYAAEFGAPYYACWFHSRIPQMTEWLAAYYGDCAYEAEDVGMLEKSKEFAKCCRRMTHGGWVDNKDLYAFNSLGEEYSRMSVYRVNRAWRAYGQNGGLMYLTSWNWDQPNTMRDRQMTANGDIVTFLGGDPDPTDRTHAYWSGSEIKKNLVFVWDGVGSNKLSAAWKLVAVDGGKILIDQLDPFQAGDRYRAGDGKAAKIAAGGWGMIPKDEKDLFLRNASQSEDNFMRRYAIVLNGWGVGAGEKVFARSLYTKPAQAYDPIAQYNVLGPWPSAQDDDHYMVDTIFPVDASKGGTDGAEAEAMAIRGDVQPNPRFYPQGLTYLSETPADLRFLDWRPVAKSRADGFVDYSTAHPLIAAQAFATCYCVGFLPRRTDGEITIRFGVDWRGKIWVNGKAFDPIYGGHKDEGSMIYEHVKVWGMPPPGTDLKKFDKEHGTFDGKNVISIKAGCGQSAKTFWLNVSHELQEGEVVRTAVPELDAVALYETANVQFDPYEYVYW